MSDEIADPRFEGMSDILLVLLAANSKDESDRELRWAIPRELGRRQRKRERDAGTTEEQL